jgi:hypothetical protein
MKEDVRVHKEKFTYIPIYTSFNNETWSVVTEAVKKIPSVFTVNTLQELYDYVDNLKNNIPNTDSFNADTWNMVYARTNMIPNTFNSNTLQQMYNNVNDLMSSGGSGSGGSGSSSGVDYSQDIKALQTAVNAIPSTFNSSTWTNVRNNISEILNRIINLPYLSNLPKETYTWVKLVNDGKKVPESFLVSTLQTIKDSVDWMLDRFTYIPNTGSFNIATWTDHIAAVTKVPTSFTVTTLQTMYNDVDYMKDRFNYIPNTNSFNIATWSDLVNAVTELQQTVSNMISQLNAQSFIDLGTLQTALDEADCTLETIAEILQQMQ